MKDSGPRVTRALLALAIALACSATPARADEPSARIIAVAIAGGKAKGSDTLKVKQGERVELQLSADKPMVLHLHGYELEAKVDPPKPGLLAFKAAIPGRFPVHEHREGPGNHRAVLFIEVHP
jgi:hypothetical protein